MNTAIINFTTDPKLKEQAQKVSKELGIPLSLVLNNYLRHLVKTKTVVFSNEEPTQYLIKSIKKAEKDIKAGRVSPTFDDAEDAIKWLHKHSE